MNTKRQMAVSAAIVVAAAGAVGGYVLFSEPTSVAPLGEHAGHGATGTGSPGAEAPVYLTADAANRIGITYATAEQKALLHEVRALGNVMADERRLATVNPKIEGWVERLHVNFRGAPISRGQPLLEIYSPMIVSAQEELILARRLVEQSSASGTARAADNARELLDSARRRLRYLDFSAAVIDEIERSGTAQRTMTVTSPVNGVVVEKNVVEGMRIMPGMDIYQVADLSRVWVEVDVFEKDFALIRLGQHAVVTFDAYPGDEFQAPVTYVYPTLNAQARTGRVRLELPNPNNRLKPGMYAQVLLHLSTPHEMIVVPRTAVLQTGERSVVFIRRGDGALEPRRVQVGMVSGNEVEIVTGVQSGDVVVSSASFLIDAESNLGASMDAMDAMDAVGSGSAPADPGHTAADPNSPQH